MKFNEIISKSKNKIKMGLDNFKPHTTLKCRYFAPLK